MWIWVNSLCHCLQHNDVITTSWAQPLDVGFHTYLFALFFTYRNNILYAFRFCVSSVNWHFHRCCLLTSSIVARIANLCGSGSFDKGSQETLISKERSAVKPMAAEQFRNVWTKFTRLHQILSDCPTLPSAPHQSSRRRVAQVSGWARCYSLKYTCKNTAHQGSASTLHFKCRPHTKMELFLTYILIKYHLLRMKDSNFHGFLWWHTFPCWSQNFIQHQLK